jgi:hypothetical protein
MSNAKAPVLGHFGAAMAGLSTHYFCVLFSLVSHALPASVRAYGAQTALINISLDRIDSYTRLVFLFFFPTAKTRLICSQDSAHILQPQ